MSPVTCHLSPGTGSFASRFSLLACFKTAPGMKNCVTPDTSLRAVPLHTGVGEVIEVTRRFR
jgi:hypothetical protein